MAKKIDISVFDFDGTLSASDANLEFGKYLLRHSPKTWLYLPFIIVGMLAKYLNPSGLWWRQMSRRYVTKNTVQRYAPEFIREHKKRRFDWALDAVAREREDGNIVLLISASPDYLVPYLVDDMDFDAILCSQMDALHPWKINFLCWGPGKVEALAHWAAENNVIPNVVRSYGDSPGDKFIMARANEQVWIERNSPSLAKGCRAPTVN